MSFIAQLVNADQENARLIARQREENANTITVSCKKKLETIDVASQVKYDLSGIESLFNARKFELEKYESARVKVSKIAYFLPLV